MADDQTPMPGGSPTTALHTPEAVAVRAEVARITADPNILHRDKQTMIDALYKKQYGEGKEIIGSGITVEGNPASPPVAGETLAPWAQEAQRELGVSFDTERQKVLEVGRKLSGGNEEAEVALYEKLLGAGFTERQIFDLARKLA